MAQWVSSALPAISGAISGHLQAPEVWKGHPVVTITSAMINRGASETSADVEYRVLVPPTRTEAAGNTRRLADESDNATYFILVEEWRAQLLGLGESLAFREILEEQLAAEDLPVPPEMTLSSRRPSIVPYDLVGNPGGLEPQVNFQTVLAGQSESKHAQAGAFFGGPLTSMLVPLVAVVVLVKICLISRMKCSRKRLKGCRARLRGTLALKEEKYAKDVSPPDSGLRQTAVSRSPKSAGSVESCVLEISEGSPKYGSAIIHNALTELEMFSVTSSPCSTPCRTLNYSPEATCLKSARKSLEAQLPAGMRSPLRNAFGDWVVEEIEPLSNMPGKMPMLGAQPPRPPKHKPRPKAISSPKQLTLSGFGQDPLKDSEKSSQGEWISFSPLRRALGGDEPPRSVFSPVPRGKPRPLALDIPDENMKEPQLAQAMFGLPNSVETPPTQKRVPHCTLECDVSENCETRPHRNRPEPQKAGAEEKNGESIGMSELEFETPVHLLQEAHRRQNLLASSGDRRSPAGWATSQFELPNTISTPTRRRASGPSHD